MTEQGERGRKILVDIRLWLAGEYPTPVHIVMAPLLEEWSVVWIQNPEGKGTPMRIEGIVSGRDNMYDGEKIRTTPVILFDPDFKWCRSTNTTYRLGQQAGIEIPIEGIWT